MENKSEIMKKRKNSQRKEIHTHLNELTFEFLVAIGNWTVYKMPINYINSNRLTVTLLFFLEYILSLDLPATVVISSPLQMQIIILNSTLSDWNRRFQNSFSVLAVRLMQIFKIFPRNFSSKWYIIRSDLVS